MNCLRLLALPALSAAVVATVLADPGDPRLPRAQPEAQGVAAAQVLQYVEAADATVNAMHSFILVRHGHVVAEGWWAPYDRAEPHLMFSLSKSFTSTAVGLAQAEGKLNIYDPVASFFPDLAPAHPSKNQQALRIRDLLRMSSGQTYEAITPFPFDSSDNLARVFLNLPVEFKPGTHFVYNTPATYMCSAVVQKATGQSVHDYLLPRLFQPLGIGDPRWDASAQGVSFGGFGLSLRTEDIACFGQLLLQRGQWRGRQLVPAAWIDEATARQTSNGGDPAGNWDQGYGYQFWRCPPPGVYRGDGAFGQLCVVMPPYDAVVAVTAGTADIGNELDLIWKYLLPALKDAALPADAAADRRLAARLASLTLPLPPGSATPAAGALGRKFVFADNPQKLESFALQAAPSGAGYTVSLRLAGRDETFTCGAGAWARGVWELPPDVYGTGGHNVIATAGAWTSPDDYALAICHYRTPITTAVRLHFAGDACEVFMQDNVSLSGAPPLVHLTGRTQS
jgi:CubicO group peptidase (beta-lactamase class C family)